MFKTMIARFHARRAARKAERTLAYFLTNPVVMAKLAESGLQVDRDAVLAFVAGTR